MKQSDKKFNNKVVLVTGASSGIGAALARELFTQGASLVLLARRTQRLITLAAEIDPTGERILAVPCDVTKDGALEQAVSLARHKFAKIDIAIANAGWSLKGNLETLSLQDYQRQWDTNVFGVLRTIYATLEDLKQTQGRLVVISSVKSYLAQQGDSAYSTSKFALRALCASLSGELAPYGVSVTHICPAYVATEIRKIDNQGTLHNDWPDQISPRLLMGTAQAAQQIVYAIHCRRREQVLSTYGKLIVFLQPRFPWLVSWLIFKSKVKPISRQKQEFSHETSLKSS
ncbi:MAG: SDR family NAD(P)-dependent oxidoreductase [Cyanobacteria bacterium P01_C01_bin.118]